MLSYSMMNDDGGTGQKRGDDFGPWHPEHPDYSANLAERVTRDYGSRGRHLPFCPGSLAKHDCWPECAAARAALKTSDEPLR